MILKQSTLTKDGFGILLFSLDQMEIHDLLESGAIKVNPESEMEYLISEAYHRELFRDFILKIEQETPKSPVHDQNIYRGLILAAKPYIGSMVYKVRWNEYADQSNVVELCLDVEDWKDVESGHYTGEIEFDDADDLKTILESYIDDDLLPAYAKQNEEGWKSFQKELWENVK